MTKITPLTPEHNAYYIGIDVHKRKWSVTILYQNMELKTFSMEPSTLALSSFLCTRYPDGVYYTVYEAGFCGFSVHRKLCALGIKNIVVHAADVPTSDKERDRKDDPRDSRKLARELRSGNLSPLYIPTPEAEQLRALCRIRHRCQQQSTRIKNRIRGHLNCFGIDAPETASWSDSFIREIETKFSGHSPGDLCIQFLLKELDEHRQRHSLILRSIRDYIADSQHATTMHLLQTIPGIGFLSAVTLVSEIVDINRFSTLNKLCAIVGLLPSTRSSGDRTVTCGLSRRKNRYLKHLIIEAAWVAVRKDPVLLAAYQQLTKRMTGTRAIVRIARKLLNRIRYVWKNQQPYISTAA